MDTELLEYMLQMLVHGVRAQARDIADVAVGLALATHDRTSVSRGVSAALASCDAGASAASTLSSHIASPMPASPSRRATSTRPSGAQRRQLRAAALAHLQARLSLDLAPPAGPNQPIILSSVEVLSKMH